MPAMLIIRPKDRAAADMQTCAGHGWQGIAFTPFSIEALPQAQQKLPEMLDSAAAAFWVSPSAVEQAGSLKTYRCPHIAVGRATAAALAQAGAAHIVCQPGGHDSEAVWQLDIWQTLPHGAKIAIVRGEGGRDWLGTQLTNTGFQVRYAEIYRRVPQNLDWPLFQAACAEAAWVVSAAAAAEVFAQAPDALTQKLKSLLYFTHHPRIAAALAELGAERICLTGSLADALNRYPQHPETPRAATGEIFQNTEPHHD